MKEGKERTRLQSQLNGDFLFIRTTTLSPALSFAPPLTLIGHITSRSLPLAPPMDERIKITSQNSRDGQGMRSFTITIIALVRTE